MRQPSGAGTLAQRDGGGDARFQRFGLQQVPHAHAAAQHVGDETVCRREPVAPVHDEHDPSGLLHRALGLHRHRLLDAARRLDQAAGVHHDESVRSITAVAVLPVARHARHVGDQRVARARQHVEERGLADIGAPDQGDHRQHGVWPAPRGAQPLGRLR